MSRVRHNTSVQIEVDNRLRLSVADGEAHDRLLGACKHSNPTFYKLKSMGKKWIKDKPTITTSKDHGGGLISLPRGRTDDVRKVLHDRNLCFEFEDCRYEGDEDYALDCDWEHNVELWDHQQRIVEGIMHFEQGIVRAPTGSGKTAAALAAIAQIQLPTLVVVWSSKLAAQWVERLVKEFGLHPRQIGFVGDGRENWRPITIAMQQTLARSSKKLARARKLFGVVVCDEVQRFAADTFIKVIDTFPAKYRVGFSADERRKDGKEFLIYDMFGKVIVEVKRKELEAKKLVLPVELRVVPTDYVDEEYRKALEDPDANADFNALLERMTENKARNELMASVTFNAPAVVLTHRREHALWYRAEMASRNVGCGLLLGGKEDSEEFERTVEGLRDEEDPLELAVGTYQAFGVGMDVPPIGRGICATPIHTNKQFFGQVRGRLCRQAPGKEGAELMYLWDRKVFGVSALKALSRWNDKRVTVYRDGEWVSVDDYLETVDGRG